MSSTISISRLKRNNHNYNAQRIVIPSTKMTLTSKPFEGKSMSFSSVSPQCGSRDQNPFGIRVGIEIPGSFTLQPLKEDRKIESWVQKTTMESIVLNYFSFIYQSDQPSQFSPITDAIERRVTGEMNDSLLKEFQPDEVQQALHQMHPTKSLSLDSMPPLFVQKYWSIVGQDVTDCVLNILNTGEMPPKLNDTHICFIPKTKNPPKKSLNTL